MPIFARYGRGTSDAVWMGSWVGFLALGTEWRRYDDKIGRVADCWNIAYAMALRRFLSDNVRELRPWVTEDQRHGCYRWGGFALEIPFTSFVLVKWDKEHLDRYCICFSYSHPLILSGEPNLYFLPRRHRYAEIPVHFAHVVIIYPYTVQLQSGYSLLSKLR